MIIGGLFLTKKALNRWVLDPEEIAPLTAQFDLHYSKTCLKRPIKIDKTKVLKTNGSLMKVENIAECSLGAFFNTVDLH